MPTNTMHRCQPASQCYSHCYCILYSLWRAQLALHLAAPCLFIRSFFVRASFCVIQHVVHAESRTHWYLMYVAINCYDACTSRAADQLNYRTVSQLVPLHHVGTSCSVHCCACCYVVIFTFIHTYNTSTSIIILT